METAYLQPSAFKLNKKTGKFKLIKEVDTQDIVDMTKHLLSNTIKGKFISDNWTARDFIISQLGAEDREIFACLFLDTTHCLIQFEKLFYGTIDEANVYVRIIAKKALILNAATIICVHNHPSGVAKPSLADLEVTKRIVQGLDLIEVKVMDHFIVVGPRVISFRKLGFGELFDL